jgi:hypothetical protein
VRADEITQRRHLCAGDDLGVGDLGRLWTLRLLAQLPYRTVTLLD